MITVVRSVTLPNGVVRIQFRTEPMGWVSMATAGGDQLLQPTTDTATTATTGGAAINAAADAALAATAAAAKAKGAGSAAAAPRPLAVA